MPGMVLEETPFVSDWTLTWRRKPPLIKSSFASSSAELLVGNRVSIQLQVSIPFSPSTDFLEIPPVGTHKFETRFRPSYYFELAPAAQLVRFNSSKNAYVKSAMCTKLRYQLSSQSTRYKK